MADTNTNEAALAESLAAAAALESSDDTDTTVADSEEVADDAGSDTSDSDESSESDTDADESSDEGDADEEDEGDDSEGAPSDDVDAIRQKFLDGDVDEALKDLKLDPKILQVNGPKLKAMREGLKATKELEASASTKLAAAEAAEAKAAQLYEQGKKELGPVLKLQRLLAKGDFMAAKDLLEALAPSGTTYKQIAEGIAAAARGMSPAEELYRRRLRELDEKEQTEKAEREAAEQKAKQPKPEELAQKNLDGAKKLLAGSPLAEIPGAAEKLVELAAKNWDPVKKGLKVSREDLVKQLAKDPVMKDLLEFRRLKASKGKTPEPTEKPRDQKSGRFRERPRVKASNLTPEQQRAAKKEADFKASVAEAAALERQQLRAAKSGKGRR